MTEVKKNVQKKIGGDLMHIEKNIDFINDATEQSVSEQIKNNMSDNLTLQVSGDFTAAKVFVEGKVDPKGSWREIGVIDFKTLEFFEAIGAIGEYQCCVTGIEYLRINVDSVEGGSIRIFGRLTY